MKKLISLLFLITIACQPSEKTQENLSTKSISEGLKLVDFDGEEIQLTSKVTILNLWATWCKPCIAEMPSLEAMQKQLPQDITLYLASDEPLSRQLAFLKKRSFDLTFVQMQSSMEALGVYALPTTLILDRDGKILDTIVGMREWNSTEQINHITSFLK